MSHVSHWPVHPLFGLAASTTIGINVLAQTQKKPVCGKNTHGPSREQLTPLTLKLVTNTDAEDEKSTTKSSFETKITSCQGLKETACLIPATCLAHYYILYNTVPPLYLWRDKTKKSCQSGEQTEPQKPGTVLSQVTEGQVTFKQPFKWLHPANNELGLLENGSVCCGYN